MVNQLDDGELERRGGHGGHAWGGDLFWCRQAVVSFLAPA